MNKNSNEIRKVPTKFTQIPNVRFPGFEGAWESKKLKELCEINPKSESLPDSFIYIDLESVVNGCLLKEDFILKDDAPSRAQRLLLKNDVLFQMVRPYQKNNLFFDKDGNYVASTGYAQIRTKNNPKFIFQYLHTQKFVDKVIKRCTGTSYPAINSKDLSSIKINFPTIKEQTKIAKFLTLIDNRIQTSNKIIEDYKLLKKGVMQKIFKQEIRFKDENGNDFPEWEVRKLGEVADITMGQSPDSKSYNDNKTGFPLIQGNADIQNRVSNPRQWTNQPTKICDISDLILTVRAPVGSISKSIHNACIGRGVCAIKNKSIINIDFLYQLLLWYEPKWIRVEQGSTFTAVSGKDIKNLKFLIPNLQEQQKIAATLSAIDQKIALEKGNLDKLEAQKKYLLQNLFV